MSHVLEFSPHHPDYDITLSPTFSECYHLAHSLICPVEGHRPASIILDRGQPRTCAICGGTEENTTFESEAHTLPASFGNRHHTTNEECDQCNLQFGSEYEKHLAAWLNPERTLHRIRRRVGEPPPTLKGPNGSSVEVDGSTGALVLKFDSTQIEQMINSENKEVEISYIRPACNRVSALRSLLKTTWLFLTPEERKQHPLILKLIKKEATLPRWEFWDLTSPGNGSASVQFEIWRKKSSVNDDIAPLIVRFIIGNTILLWIEPNEVTGIQLPSPFPPVRARVSENDSQSISATLLEVEKDEIFPEKEEKILFSYGSLQKGVASLPLRAPPKPLQTKFEIKLIHEAEAEIDIYTTCYVRVVDQNRIRLFISGNEFAGTIIIESDSSKAISTAKINLTLEEYPATSTLKTINFLRSLREQKGKVLLRQNNGEVLFILDEFSSTKEIPAPKIENILTDIITLNEEFGTDLKYNKFANDEDLLDLLILAKAIKENGTVEMPFLKNTLTLNTKKIGALNLIEMIEKDGPSDFHYSSPVIYELWGTTFPLLDRKVILPKASLASPALDLKAKLNNLAEEASFGVPLKDEKIIYEFLRWKKSSS